MISESDNAQFDGSRDGSRWLSAPSFALTLAAGLVILILAFWTVRRSEQALDVNLKSKFSTIVQIETEAIRDWIESEQRLVKLLANSPQLSEIVRRVDAGELPDAKRNELDELLKEQLGQASAHGIQLWAADREMIASQGRDSLQFDADANVRFPAVSGLLVDDNDQQRYIYRVSAPVGKGTSDDAGLLVVDLDVRKELTRILETSRTGRTGETIAVDQNGVFISHGRFESDYNRLQMFVEKHAGDFRQPTGKILIDLSGRIDNRGVPVVSASRWMPQLKLGLVTKMDRTEATAPIATIRRFLWSLAALLALTTISAVAYRWTAIRQQQLARTAELDRMKLGPYELEDKLGEGGMGIVYRARHALLRRPTAVKLLPPSRSSPKAVERFEQEVRFTSQLSHPNTIAIYDYGRTGSGLFYYAMELLDGLNLDELVQQEGPVPDGRTIFILRQVCQSLAEAHRLGLIHRDIKPANIMLCDCGGKVDMVKVLDFGMVHDRNVKLDENSNSIAGTPAYMAPESIHDLAHIDARVDVFAVGAVGYYLLTGQPLLDVTDVRQIAGLHGEEIEFVALAKLKRSLKLQRTTACERLIRLISRSVTRDRNYRTQSINAFIEELSMCQPEQTWTEADARHWWSENLQRLQPNGSRHHESPDVVRDVLKETQVFIRRSETSKKSIAVKS